MTQTRKYTTLADEIRKDILSGRYGWEGGIPEESELAQKNNLARGTVRSALTLLQGEGLIVQRGRNFYVNRVPYPMTEYMPPIVERMEAQGKDGYIRNVQPVTRITLPVYLADKANASHETSVVFQVCILGEKADGTERNTQYSRYYFITATDEQMNRLQNDPKVDPLEENEGEEVKRQEEIIARQATQEEAKILGLPRTTSVLGVISIVRDEHNKLLLIQEDAFSPRITLTYDYAFKNRPS